MAKLSIIIDNFDDADLLQNPLGAFQIAREALDKLQSAANRGVTGKLVTPHDMNGNPVGKAIWEAPEPTEDDEDQEKE